MPTTPSKTPPTTKSYRLVTDSPTRTFGQWITHHSWIEVLTVDDVYGSLTTLTTAYQRFVSMKTRRVHPSDTPWNTLQMKRLIQQRNQAFQNNPSIYKPLQNQIKRELKKAIATYYPQKIHSLKHFNISKCQKKDQGPVCVLSNPIPIPGVSQPSTTDAPEDF